MPRKTYTDTTPKPGKSGSDSIGAKAPQPGDVSRINYQTYSVFMGTKGKTKTGGMIGGPSAVDRRPDSVQNFKDNSV